MALNLETLYVKYEEVTNGHILSTTAVFLTSIILNVKCEKNPFSSYIQNFSGKYSKIICVSLGAGVAS